MCCLFVFFFQAEDGIRDIGVTGVQTCALPISARPGDDRNSFFQSAHRSSLFPCFPLKQFIDRPHQPQTMYPPHINTRKTHEAPPPNASASHKNSQNGPHQEPSRTTAKLLGSPAGRPRLRGLTRRLGPLTSFSLR